MKRKIFKTAFLVGLLFIIASLFNPTFSEAQGKEFPTKPITLIGPMEDGGAADIMLRALASVMHNYIEQPCIVINKPGGQGSVAGNFLAKSKPDGHTVACLISPAAVPEIYTYFFEAPYTSADLKPVMRIAIWPYALSVRAGSPWKTMEDFINYAKKNPGKVTYGHAGRGHMYHLFMTAFTKKAGIEVIDVPFKGGGPTNTALLGGHIDLGISATGGQQPFVEAGKFRMLAIEYTKRLDVFKDVPTFKELGYDFGMSPAYNSLFVPKNTPDAIAKKLHDSFKKALDDTSFKAIAAKAAINIDYGDAETVKKELEGDKKVVGELLKELGFWKK